MGTVNENYGTQLGLREVCELIQKRRSNCVPKEKTEKGREPHNKYVEYFIGYKVGVKSMRQYARRGG